MIMIIAIIIAIMFIVTNDDDDDDDNDGENGDDYDDNDDVKATVMKVDILVRIEKLPIGVLKQGHNLFHCSKGLYRDTHPRPPSL